MTLRSAIVTFRRLARDTRGNVLALTSFALPFLVASAGLAVDTIQWVTAKRDLQATVDAAAVAGVYGIIQTGDMESAVDRSIASDPDIDPKRAVSAERSPDGYREDSFAVRVRLTAPLKLSFSSLFLSKAPSVTVEATASVVETGEFCAFALGSDSTTGLKIEAGADVQLECGIATNSTSTEAVQAESASVRADYVIARGAIGKDGIKSDRLRSYGVRQKDPLENTEPPLVPDTGCPNITVNPDAAASNDGRLVLEPGCYGNLVINGPVFLRDGEYILNRGSLMVGPTAELSCTACTIFLTSNSPATEPGSIGKIRIDHHAKVKLAAPTQGPNAGILIYQDRHAEGDYDSVENLIGGNSFSELKGLVYVPGEVLRVNGEFNPDMQCARFVGRKLIFRGRVFIARGCSGSNVSNFSGTEVKLVG